MTVFKHLGSLINYFHNSFRTDFLPLHYGGNHDTGRGSTNGTGQKPFSKFNQFSVSLHIFCEINFMGAGICCESPVSLPWPNKTGEQVFEFGDHGLAFPQVRIATVPVNIYKKGGLYPIHGALSVKERNAYQESDVDKHTPEDRMGDRVKHIEAKKLIWLQQFNTEGAMLKKRDGDPA